MKRRKNTINNIISNEDREKLTSIWNLQDKVGNSVWKEKILSITKALNSNDGLINSDIEQSLIEIKPVFKPEVVKTVFNFLKDFFSKEHQKLFKKMLETGETPSKPLIFLDNGNRLADAFKQLIKSDFITGCKQKELEKWISENFKYRFRKQIKDFTSRYLNDIISTNKDKCQRPIFNVNKDKIKGTYLISKV